MYREEQIINGRLYWRGTPNGEWIAYTPEQLAAMLLAARKELWAIKREEQLDNAIGRAVFA